MDYNNQMNTIDERKSNQNQSSDFREYFLVVRFDSSIFMILYVSYNRRGRIGRSERL